MLILFREVIAPEFASKTDAAILAMIDLVEQGMNLAGFGARLNEAVLLLVAHRFTLNARRAELGASAGTGPIKSQAAGGVSISYGGGMAARAWSDEALAQTSHGVEFLALRESRAGFRMGIC